MQKQKDDTENQDKDLKDHGVQDIIPENGEYYTVDLQRDFDGLETDEEEMTDIAGENPLDENDDDLADIVGREEDEDAVDEDNEGGVEVGEPGHWGVDEDTD